MTGSTTHKLRPSPYLLQVMSRTLFFPVWNYSPHTFHSERIPESHNLTWFTHIQFLVCMWFPLGAPAKRLEMPSPSSANAWLIDRSGLPRRNQPVLLLLPPPLPLSLGHHHLYPPQLLYIIFVKFFLPIIPTFRFRSRHYFTSY